MNAELPDTVTVPTIEDLGAIPTGDMPGDKVQIGEGHVAKATTAFPRLWEVLRPILEASPHQRAVIAVHGGSGVGKSEIGSLIAHYLRANGIGAYVMSGDNYPRRIPRDNDAERLRTFRTSGVRGLVDAGVYDDSVRRTLADLQAVDRDADPAVVLDHPWLVSYQRAGRTALDAYLGTRNEIDFDEVSGILARFQDGATSLNLKRMGRELGELWYSSVDVSDVEVLVIEWTHGNSDFLTGVDIPLLLNSTPEETLAHRRSRARDGATDSPFTTMVLALEQAKLAAQAHKATVIVSKSGEVIDYDAYLESMGRHLPGSGPMLNVYPDSVGGTVGDLVDLVTDPAAAGAFSAVYMLPSVFNTDLDRGFSVIDYGLNRLYASRADLDALRDAGISLKLDFILNHASVLSPQFQDLLARGDASAYKDFFIDWNAFWAGHGTMTDAGYVQPDAELIRDMYFRKPGLPILMVRLPDGTERPYWNTFYQEVRYTAPSTLDVMKAANLQYASAEIVASRVAAALGDGKAPADADYTGFEDAREAVVELVESRRTYLGQMDLDIRSQSVWDFYAHTLDTLAGYGAEIVRLDAFAYAPKEPGAKNFLNDPGTWDVLARVKALADDRGLKLLPEIHASYSEGIHELLASKGFVTYDFFLPGLVIDALARRDASVLKRWIVELVTKKIRTVNMLGCHDGIPLLDLKGLLDDDRIETVIETVKSRGGYVKDLHGAKNIYYQVNATYYSALGSSDAALLLARAIQLFTPGKPQVWYLDLFAGRNDHEAVERAGAGGHKEINRTNLSREAVRAGLEQPVVRRQLELLRFRNAFGAFGFDAECEVADTAPDQLHVTWRNGGHEAVLDANLTTYSFAITADGQPV
ncbi:MAG: sucrose phosphorylase [Propionibacteriaceae bacterium]